MSSRTALMQWYLDREGKVDYSDESPLGPDSFDSAGALFSALKAGQFLSGGSEKATVDFLLNLEGVMVHKIPRMGIQAGDVFIIGFKLNGVIREDAICGVVLNPRELITCCSQLKGIGRMSSLWVLPTNIRWYRLMEPVPQNWRPKKLKTGHGLYVNGLNFDVHSDNSL